MRIVHVQFPCDLIVVLVALASGTRCTTVSSDGEDVEDLGEVASESSSRTSAEPESIVSAKVG